MDLNDFERGLAAIIGRPTSMRPFVCDGSPLDCQIFLVGIEPATALPEDFWSFWRPGRGYDKAAWQQAYQAERRRLGKGTSPTRRNSEAFLRGAGGVKVLETNVFAAPRPRYSRVGTGGTEAFDFLLKSVRPKVLFVHGTPARRKIRMMAPSAAILEANHLSYQTGPEKAREHGRNAADLLSRS